MQKKLLVCTALILSIILFTACSAPELAFYNTIKNMGELEEFSFEGTLKVKINTLEFNALSALDEENEEDEEDFPLDFEELIELINSNNIVYDGLISKSKVKFNLGLSVADETEYLIRFINENKKFYFYGDIFSMIFAGAEYEKETIDGIEYTVLTEDELIDLLAELLAGNGGEMPMFGQILNEEGDESDEDIELIKEQLRALFGEDNPSDNFNNIISKCTDEFINNFFSQLETSVISKTGDSSYKLELNSETLLSLIKEIGLYFIENSGKLKTSLKAIVNNLTDDELSSLGIDSEARTVILEGIDELPEPSEEEVDRVKEELEYMIDMLEEMFSAYDLNYVYTLTKSGIKAFDTAGTFKIKNKIDEVPLLIDIEISNILAINKEGAGNIGAQAVISGDSGTISLSDGASDASEYGLLCSLSNNLSNPLTIKGSKQNDGSYKLDLKSLEKGKTYYYKVYYKDNAGNIIYGNEVKNLKIEAEKPPVNPPTNDIVIIPATITAMMLICVALLIKKRRVYTA